MLEHYDLDGGEFELDLRDGARGLANLDVDMTDPEVKLNITVEHLDSYQRVTVELSEKVCKELGYDLLYLSENLWENHE
jgi:hypothetical protein